MAKIFPLFLALLVSLFVLPPKTVEAEPTAKRSKVHAVCQKCRRTIYALYQPVRNENKKSIYGWVPQAHTCPKTVIVEKTTEVRTNKSSSKTTTTTSQQRIVVIPKSTPTSNYSPSRSKQPVIKPRLYSDPPTTKYKSLRNSPTLKYYRNPYQ